MFPQPRGWWMMLLFQRSGKSRKWRQQTYRVSGREEVEGGQNLCNRRTQFWRAHLFLFLFSHRPGRGSHADECLPNSSLFYTCPDSHFVSLLTFSKFKVTGPEQEKHRPLHNRRSTETSQCSLPHRMLCCEFHILSNVCGQFVYSETRYSNERFQ